MAVLTSFKAIRPRKDLASKVAALPYDVMNSEEAREMVENNAYSFLHVDKAEIDLEEGIDLYDKRVYDRAKKNLAGMIHRGELLQDKSNCLYIYRQIMDGRVQTGIVGCTSIDDYLNSVIKKHEFTREDKEQDRINHVEYCNANTGPIFLTYRDNSSINEILDGWTKSKTPVYNFTSEDGISHIVWVIDEQDTIDKLIELFKRVESLYIADGHHRAASAVKVGQMRRELDQNYKGDENYNFFLSVIFSDKDLYIMNYNRIVKDINGLSIEEFIIKVSEKFNIEKYEGEGSCEPTYVHSFGMYIESKWYLITSKESTYDSNDPVLSLDVSILQNNLLEPILGIKDPRTDERIDFIGGMRGLKELEKRVDSGMKVAFSMYPTTIGELMDIADIGKVMPPKSTWFEPKLRSGLFIHSIE